MYELDDNKSVLYYSENVDRGEYFDGKIRWTT